MPNAALVACPRCGAKHAGGQCPARQAQRAAYDQARGTAASRGYGSKWRVIRAAFLKAHPCCEEPGCRDRAIDVDHRDGNPEHNAWSNLRPYCHAHHSSRTARDQGFGAAMRRRG